MNTIKKIPKYINKLDLTTVLQLVNHKKSSNNDLENMRLFNQLKMIILIHPSINRQLFMHRSRQGVSPSRNMIGSRPNSPTRQSKWTIANLSNKNHTIHDSSLQNSCNLTYRKNLWIFRTSTTSTEKRRMIHLKNNLSSSSRGNIQWTVMAACNSRWISLEISKTI